ncbi:MAG: dihydroorotate dehydrogenase-like protein [Proteobacteria bacterium]|nr:dihydroorotate dehydrogenase-like protein [Pseudomonadota bacterium]MBU1140198.1 dihydroorotate dehydrogenase-like protein [Pseudomonadota bacterium]
MKDLSTKYLGLDLKNPLIIGSCGLTNSVDKIKELADNGAGAVVLKSLFEEQIQGQLAENLESYTADYPGATDYIREYTRGNEVDTYLKLISGAKKAVDIPVIASINCVSAREWTSFAKAVEQEGADAIELNIALLPSNPKMTSEESEKKYVDIIHAVSGMVSIPVTLKMSHYSASLANLIQKLSWINNLAGFVLFNRFYTPDIDIDKMVTKPAAIFSNPSEVCESLRWIALMYGLIEKDLVASTGVHDSEGLIKQILAGATAVQIVSTVYKNGAGQIATILKGLEEWMEQKSFSSLADFRGNLSYEKIAEPAVFERTQFMKYFGGLS